jgi:hypothetical protein
MEYIIAIRRERQGEGSQNLADSLKGIPGVSIRGSSNPARVHVEASVGAIEEIRKRLGAVVHIEPIILHTPS